MIGIIGAMGVEVELIIEKMIIKNRENIGGIEFTVGKLKGKDVVVSKCGVGKVYAAMAAQAMIIKYSPNVIVNTGIAGTMTPALKIGSVVVARDVVQFDMDTSCVGDEVGMISDINLVHIPCDNYTIKVLEESSKSLGVDTHDGTIATGDYFFKNDKEMKSFVINKFSAIACEMEGAAIGQVCYVNNVPFGVLRAINDTVDDTDDNNYWKFKERAARIAANTITIFIENF